MVVERRAEARREDEIMTIPRPSERCGDALPMLNLESLAERLGGESRQRDDAAALVRLHVFEVKLAVDSFERDLSGELGTVEIEIGPAQAERRAPAQTNGDRD